MNNRDQLLDELGRCVAAVARGDDDEALGLARSIYNRMAAGTQQVLPGTGIAVVETVNEDQGVARLQVVRSLLAYWQERCDHKTARATPERLQKINARLRDGYTAAEIRKAIDGASVAAFVSDGGRKYDDIELICRNGSKLESFIARGVTATGPIQVEATVPGNASLEDRIAGLRREMAQMKRDGRDTEYEQAASELHRLMTRRAAS